MGNWNPLSSLTPNLSNALFRISMPYTVVVKQHEATTLASKIALDYDKINQNKDVQP